MRAVIAIAASLALGGCALLPAPAPKPVFNTSGEEEPLRARARTHTELAGSYFELGNIGVALDEVNVALKADASYGPAHNMAGLIYAELRDDRAAQEHFQRALRLNPIDPDANNNYGRFLCDRKRENEALKYFLAALRNPLYQNPDRSYVNAGVCSRRRGDNAAAEDFFQRALKVRPNSQQALYQLADMFYARGAYAQTKDYLYRLEQVSTPNAEVLWLSVRVERKLGDRDSEASYAAQLRRNFPSSKEAGALLAGRYE